MMQPLTSLGFSSHFEGLAGETTTSTFWIEQLQKMESKLQDIGLKCWFSTTEHQASLFSFFLSNSFRDARQLTGRLEIETC